MEVNEIKTLVESAQGSIDELSIAVMIPLNEEMEDYTENVRDLVSKAVGTPIANVSVHSMPIIQANAGAAAEIRARELDAFRQSEMLRLIIILSAVVIVVLLLLIALRTVLKALRPEPEPVPVSEEAQNESGIDFFVGDGESMDMEFDPESASEPPEPTPLEQVQEFVEKDPESVAQLLRNWLTDDYR